MELRVVTTYTSAMDGEMAAAMLRSAGIPVTIGRDAASGWHPQLDLVNGVRVLVPADQAEDAAEILGVELPEPLPPLSPEREALVSLTLRMIFGAAALGIAIALLRAWI